MEKRKRYKILKRILPIICAVLCVSTALITPVAAIVDSSQGDGDNYDITARSPYPMTVGLAFDTSDKNVVFATDIGGFGQEYNTTINGTDSFFWTSEASTAEELDGTLIYQFLDERKQGKEYKNLLEPLGSDGYGLASYRPIKISAQSGTDLTQGMDCSSIVYRLQDVVINSSVIRKGNYRANVHQDASQEAINDDNIYSPNADDYRYLIPHVVIPTISETSGYLGTYNVVASITDEWGNEWELNYSIPIDSRGATSDTFIPFLPMSIFDSYGKVYGEQAYNIGMSNTVVLNEYYGYLDVDYYEYQNVIPDFNLIVNLKAEVGGENTLIKREYLPLGEYVGKTFNEWISTVDGQNGYTVTGGVGPITITYTDTENDYTYSGTITNSNGTNVYGTSIIILDEEYTANLQREEAPSTTSSFSIYRSTILVDTYVFVEGMTWGEFVNSSYNPTIDAYPYKAFTLPNVSSSNSEVFCWVLGAGDGVRMSYSGKFVYANETIISGHSYHIGAMHSGGSGNDSGIEGPSASNDFDWGGALNEAPSASPASYTVTTTSTAEWVKVEGTEYGRSAMLTLPLWDTSNLVIGGRNYSLYSFPTIEKFIDGAKNTLIPVPEVDYTKWIGTAVGGFLNMELMPNFSIGGVLAILIGFSIVMLFLKYFAGG